MSVWKGRNILVTGGSRGIGESITKKFLSLGANVFATATTEKGVSHIESYHDDLIRGLLLDLRSKESIEELFVFFKREQIEIDTLIHNAGKTDDRLSIQVTPERWQDMIDTNLTGVFQLTQGFLKTMMRMRFGRIIAITSVVAHTGNSGQSSYCAAKAGVTGFMKSIAVELGSRGITANMIAPGFIQTEMTEGLNSEHQKKVLERIPVQRFGTGADIANACVFLADRETSYMTGQTLHVNGGLFVGP